MKIKELPQLERPYEKLENYGAQMLSNAELLAIIIKSGTRDKTSVEIAQGLLKEDDTQKGLVFLKDLSLEELARHKGIGRVKAIQIKAVMELVARVSKPSSIKSFKITSPDSVKSVVMEDLRNLNQEVMKTILLDTQNRIIKIVTNSLGNLNSTMLEAREIFKEPIKVSAANIILVHNHPSGDPTPSSSDIVFTKRILKIGELIGISVLDHIIIGDGVYSSLKALKKF